MTNCCYSQSPDHLPHAWESNPFHSHPFNPFPSFLEYTFPLPSCLIFPPQLISEVLITRVRGPDEAVAAIPQNSSSAWRQRDCFNSDRRASTSLSGSSPWTLLSLVRTLTLLVIFSFSPTTAKAQGDTTTTETVWDGRAAPDTASTSPPRPTQLSGSHLSGSGREFQLSPMRTGFCHVGKPSPLPPLADWQLAQGQISVLCYHNDHDRANLAVCSCMWLRR